MIAIGLKNGEKSINWVLCSHFRDIKVILKLKLQISQLIQTQIVKPYLLQFETCQTYHFQVTGQNIFHQVTGQNM